MAIRDSPRVDTQAEWRSPLLAIAALMLFFEALTGFAIYLLPFSEFNQFTVLLHTGFGIGMVVPVVWYVIRHWLVRKKGRISHFQLLGYVSAVVLAACSVSGLVLTWQGLIGPGIGVVWDVVHLISGLAFSVFLVVHLATVTHIKRAQAEGASYRLFYGRIVLGCVALFAAVGLVTFFHQERSGHHSAFPEDYSWRFGEDRPFAPSLARVDHSGWRESTQSGVLAAVGPDFEQEFSNAFESADRNAAGLFAKIRETAQNSSLTADQLRSIEQVLDEAGSAMKQTGAVLPQTLAGSPGCGKSGCHSEIYEEWLPSAHRYASLDDLFQRVQTLMADETSPEHTRYCAGCHDPISLFSGAKNAGNITLSAEGANEGLSCLVCHSIVQTDIQGNGDYTIRAPRRYVYELHDGSLAQVMSDFLIRVYPNHHVASYSRPLYKTAEFCAACHKQYIDKEVNTDIGKVQGQNQYDSWKNSRWYHKGDERKTVLCRECHMPLVASRDPARGDVEDYNRTSGDGKHRSHRMLASNQYVPILNNLEGAERHVELTEQWLRGEIEIPEIADKWTSGPVIRMQVVAPEEVSVDEQFVIRTILTNNKTGHDFPTGPLDMIESWVELEVEDSRGRVVYSSGHLDDDQRVISSPVSFRADGFDRRGEAIDRHNLWDLVGASYKRALYPGATDTVETKLQCPSMARGRVVPEGDTETPGRRAEVHSVQAPQTEQLKVVANLWYRKANPEFLDRVYGAETATRSPLTRIAEAVAYIKVRPE